MHTIVSSLSVEKILIGVFGGRFGIFVILKVMYRPELRLPDCIVDVHERYGNAIIRFAV